MALIDEIIQRIKEHLGVDSDVVVARALGIKQNPSQQIYNWRQRGTIPFEDLLHFCTERGISIDYLLTGQKTTGKKKEMGDWQLRLIIEGLQNQITELSKAVEELRKGRESSGGPLSTKRKM